MNTKIGSCEKCGAPIYVPVIWHSVVPPTNIYTCDCVINKPKKL